MIYTTFFPYYRQRNNYSLSECMGSFVAHSELLRQSLRYDIADSVCIILNSSPNVMSPSVQDDESEKRAIQELKNEFGADRIQHKRLKNIQEILSNPNYIFIDKAPGVTALMQARSACAGRAPVCGLVHSVFWSQMLPSWLSVLMLHQRQDALVVPTPQARQVMEDLVRQTDEMIGSRTKSSGFRSDLRIETIPYGVDVESFSRISKGAARQVLDLAGDDLVLLWFGRLDERYKADLHPLLRVIALLRGRGVPLHLVLAGSCSDKGYPGRLLELAAHLDLANQVSLFMDVSPSEKRSLFAAADVFVSPVDNVQESYGIALVEAMAAGLPVVASDWSGYRDVVVDGVTGMLAKTYWDSEAGSRASLLEPLSPNTEAEAMLAKRTVVDVEDLALSIERLAKSPELRSRMGEAGRRRALSQFSWKAVMPKFGELWADQKLRAEHGESSKAYLDLNTAFTTYASRPLDGELAVRKSSIADDILAQYNNMQADARMRNPAIVKILKQADEKTSLRELSASTGPMGKESATDLLKLGALKIDDSPEILHPKTVDIPNRDCGQDQ